MTHHQTPSDTTLAVLAGGQGKRMGQPKAELRIGSKPILTYLLEQFDWAGPTMLLLSPGQQRPEGADGFDTVVEDSVAGEGPLRGMLTALEHANTPHLVATTVDMPCIASAHLQRLSTLLEEMPESGVILFRRQDPSGLLEPFPSAYRCALAKPLVRDQLRLGRRAMHSLTEQPGVTVLPAPSEWDASAWTNLNVRADLDEFLQRFV